MRLKRELLNLRRFLFFGVIGLALLANFSSRGVLITSGAWLCFLLLLITYLFDIAFHSVGRKS